MEIHNALAAQPHMSSLLFLPGNGKKQPTPTERAILAAVARADDLDNAFRPAVAQVCVAAGIKQLPDDMVVDACKAFWKEFYAGYNAAELPIALKLNLAGQLGPRLEHYQQFDLTYMSALMNAYRKPRAQAIVGTWSDGAPQPPDAAQLRATAIASWRTILKQFHQFKSTAVFRIDLVDYWYGQFEQHGFITLTNAEKQILADTVKEELRQKLFFGAKAFHTAREYRDAQRIMIDKAAAHLKLICRTRAILEYWQKVGEEEFEQKVQQLVSQLKQIPV